ncbi:hypothetical protein [Streptomyces sp. NPDC058145]|uniref:hypothetical protein n=1 Tax=Streptomyces sp. NPDC058145 TaxID=3346356 RepID=UPI0036EFD804
MTDWRRVAAIESAGGTSSGYRITPHLVLTTGHGIPDPASGGEVRVAFMLSPRQRWKATVVWHSRYGCREGDSLRQIGRCKHKPPAHEAAESLDLALLCVDAGTDGAREQTPVRWGRFATGQRQETEAVCFPNRQRYQGYLDPYGVRGTIEPVTGYWTNLYTLHERGDSAAHGVQDWQGMSGAATFISGFFVGCAQTFDRTGFKVMPAARIMLHPCVRAWIKKDTGVPPAVEPVDLRHVFTAPPPRPRTPAQLLDPEVEATPFHGSRDLIRELADWCRDAGDTGVRLLTGPMGVGKTRTAVELIRELTLGPEKWAGAAGFLRQKMHSEQEWERIFETVQTRLLLVVDRAEARDKADIEALLDAADRHSDRVRVLLIARSADAYGNRFVPDPVPVLEVTHDLYAASRDALDHHLGAVKPWRASATISERLSALPQSGSPAEIQLAALTQLLGERGLAHLAEDSRMVLLDMERQYVRSAVCQRLPRVDEDLLDLVLTSVALSEGRSESESARDVLEALRFRYRHITGAEGLQTDYRVVLEVDAILESLSSLYPPREAVHHGSFPGAVIAAQIVRAWGRQRSREFVSQLLEDETRFSADCALEEVHCLFPDTANGLRSPEAERPEPEADVSLADLFGDSDDDLPEPDEYRNAPELGSNKTDVAIKYEGFDSHDNYGTWSWPEVGNHHVTGLEEEREFEGRDIDGLNGP